MSHLFLLVGSVCVIAAVAYTLSKRCVHCGGFVLEIEIAPYQYAYVCGRCDTHSNMCHLRPFWI